MKRKLLYAAGFIAITIGLTACELFGLDCQTCQEVSYENGMVINYGPEAEYCDEDLIAIKAIPPVTVYGVTTQWECW